MLLASSAILPCTTSAESTDASGASMQSPADCLWAAHSFSLSSFKRITCGVCQVATGAIEVVITLLRVVTSPVHKVQLGSACTHMVVKPSSAPC